MYFFPEPQKHRYDIKKEIFIIMKIIDDDSNNYKNESIINLLEE